MPGSLAITSKRGLAESMVRSYGRTAFATTPPSWVLPEEYWDWRAYVQAQVGGSSNQAQCSWPCCLAGTVPDGYCLILLSAVQMCEAGSLWVLKRDVHRAQGVHVLPFWQASKEVRLLAHISWRVLSALAQQSMPLPAAQGGRDANCPEQVMSVIADTHFLAAIQHYLQAGANTVRT